MWFSMLSSRQTKVNNFNCVSDVPLLLHVLCSILDFTLFYILIYVAWTDIIAFPYKI